jgi:hypothetical protein
MKKELARKLLSGELHVSDLEKPMSIAESTALGMGACLTDDGDLWCMMCNKPNECCECD